MEGVVQNYYKIARENEEVFRNILKDLKDNRRERPMREFIPMNLETEVSLDEIFEKYSEGVRWGKFTITYFSLQGEEKARIGFRDLEFLSGGGAELEYSVDKDNSVKYERVLGMRRRT